MFTLRIRMLLYVLLVAAATGAGAIGYGLYGYGRALEAEHERAAHAAAALLASTLTGAITTGGAGAPQEAARRWVARGVFSRVTVDDPLGNRLAHAMAPASTRAEGPGVRGWVARLEERVKGWGGEPPLVTEPIVGPDGSRLGLVRVQLAAPSARALRQDVVARAVTMGAAVLGAVTLVTVAGAGRVTGPLERIRRAVRALEGEQFRARAPVRGAPEMAALAHGINNVAERLEGMSADQASMTEKSNFINNVVESMVATLMVVDKDARIRALNQATVNLLGYHAEELVGKSSSLICVADGFHLTSTRLQQLLGLGSMKDHEVAFISKDNRHIPVSLSGSAIKDAHGRITGYVCIGTDITERKQAESEKQKLNSQLVATSRQAGMAEVATGVLHNVGNVLNSINVSASVAEETLRKSRVPMVKQVADLLGAHAGDLGEFMSRDEKGRMVPSYLAKLAAHLAEEQAALLNEIKTLTSHVGHVKDIISVQQSVSRTAGVVEPVALCDLVEGALQIVAATASRYHIDVVREFTEVPQVRTDRHRVLQILVNLMTNAMDAMKETVGEREGRLFLRIRRHAPDPRCLRVEVEDNGVGIAPENLARLFTHGFTTKQRGHGFGLHSSSLAAKDLQASLTAFSRGAGQGATFTLVLPVEPAPASPGASDAGVMPPAPAADRDASGSPGAGVGAA